MAHEALERYIEASELSKSAILYLNGAPPVEKARTHKEREKKRHQYHENITKNANRAFHWSSWERQAFAEHMRRRGWTIKECPFETDIAITAACKCDDIVVSSDSDYLAYQSVRTIIRPFRESF
ncbi:hypothetical protein BG011_001324 [Mortierella polycephala]|uniref:PIN domain-containing protein n=1 Tax=Mortierella polycephala TaxID=41804 RepID=A0A9P6U6E1_9FUNG|nr:hypothetical protein BG011_001324 [Mortierella polycephala]